MQLIYATEFTKKATAALKTMPRNTAPDYWTKINSLAANPYAANNNVKKLVHQDGYHLRVGDWHIIYEIETNKYLIIVLAILPRGKAYL